MSVREDALRMGGTPHLLVVDDDREIRDLLDRFLKKHGFRVTLARDGKEMRDALAGWRIDLVVLDLMLPGEDGVALCRELRRKSDIPVIMLTAMSDETDRVVGLEVGADDYVAKPFSSKELLARVKAVLRRVNQRSSTRDETAGLVYRFCGWSLDPKSRRVTSPDGVLVALSAGEFDLLHAFVTHPGHVLSRDQLLDLTHGRDAAPFDRNVDMQVSRLRRKVERDSSAPELIKTVRSGGYVLAAQVETDETADSG